MLHNPVSEINENFSLNFFNDDIGCRDTNNTINMKKTFKKAFNYLENYLKNRKNSDICVHIN